MMTRRTLAALTVSATLVASPVVQAAGDAEAGRIKAVSCSGCHGIRGISTAAHYPNLAGQKRGYLVATLQAYRNGTREQPIMSPMARGLSDEDIEDLAAYYSQLPCDPK